MRSRRVSTTGLLFLSLCSSLPFQDSVSSSFSNVCVSLIDSRSRGISLAQLMFVVPSLCFRFAGVSICSVMSQSGKPTDDDLFSILVVLLAVLELDIVPVDCLIDLMRILVGSGLERYLGLIFIFLPFQLIELIAMYISAVRSIFRLLTLLSLIRKSLIGILHIGQLLTL